jgi:hypothetical protein
MLSNLGLRKSLGDGAEARAQRSTFDQPGAQSGRFYIKRVVCAPVTGSR